MSYRWARWLDDALRAEGCLVVPEPGWENRGRWRSDGRRDLPPNWAFEPNGLFVWHHTASTTTAADPWPTRNTLIYGRSDLPGPLCQVSPDHNGKVHLVAAGRANHAGTFSGAGPTVRGADGNVTSIGCEIDTNGTQPIPIVQYRASIRCAAAVNRRFKRDSSWSLGHAETSVTGKWDPGVGGKTVDLAAWRRDTAECLSYPPGVWYSKKGLPSWGEVDLSALWAGVAASGPARKDTVSRLQYAIKRSIPGAVARKTREAVRTSGQWDGPTVAAVSLWQQHVWAPDNPGDKDGFTDGKRLGPRQAEALFGPRYHLVNRPGAL